MGLVYEELGEYKLAEGKYLEALIANLSTVFYIIFIKGGFGMDLFSGLMKGLKPLMDATGVKADDSMQLAMLQGEVLELE